MIKIKKIKVLQFPIGNARGGITQYALRNWDFIDKDIFQFDFATRSDELDFEDELKAKGCKVHHLSCSSEDDEEQFIKEINIILDSDYDVVHLHTSYWKGFLVEKIAIERKCPIVIIHAHSTMVEISDDIEREKSIRKHYEIRDSLPVNYGTHFAACSKEAAMWLFGEQIPRENIITLKNAIDLNEFSFNEVSRNIYREQLNLNGKFVIGHVGRFVYSKNHDFLIEIFREIYLHNQNVRLVLVGVGELEDAIRKKVLKYNLEDVVIFLGKRNDINKIMQAFDIFLFPSQFEGLGLSLIEAQASGLKCIASNHVPREAGITRQVIFLELNVNLWVKNIRESSYAYNRDLDINLYNSDYNIKNQIKNIQKLYLGDF